METGLPSRRWLLFKCGLRRKWVRDTKSTIDWLLSKLCGIKHFLITYLVNSRHNTIVLYMWKFLLKFNVLGTLCFSKLFSNIVKFLSAFIMERRFTDILHNRMHIVNKKWHFEKKDPLKIESSSHIESFNESDKSVIQIRCNRMFYKYFCFCPFLKKKTFIRSKVISFLGSSLTLR